MTRSTWTKVGLLTAILAFGAVTLAPAQAVASGRLGGGVSTPQAGDTIKVQKAYYADVGAYVELLVMASSSDRSAHLYAYLPNGQLLGEVQNGGGGRYGGTVFGCFGIPATLTIASTSGGIVTVATAPFQP